MFNCSMYCLADPALKWQNGENEMKLFNEEPEMNRLQLIKYTDAEGNSRTFRLIEQIQNHCKRLGIRLGIEKVTLDGFDNRPTPEEKCEKILELWMMRGDGEYEVTWAGLLQALEDLQLNRAARHLRKALKMATVK